MKKARNRFTLGEAKGIIEKKIGAFTEEQFYLGVYRGVPKLAERKNHRMTEGELTAIETEIKAIRDEN